MPRPGDRDTASSEFRVEVEAGGEYRLDSVTFFNYGTLDDSDFEYTEANELTSQTDNRTETVFTYDAWGRTVSKTVGNTVEGQYFPLRRSRGMVELPPASSRGVDNYSP